MYLKKNKERMKEESECMQRRNSVVCCKSEARVNREEMDTAFSLQVIDPDRFLQTKE